MLVLLSLACGGPPPPPPLPPGVLDTAARLQVVGDGLVLDGAPVLKLSDLDAAPTDEDDPRLVEAVSALGMRPLWIELPGDTPFWKARRVIGSARAANLPATWVSATGTNEAFPLVAPPRHRLGGPCGGEPAHVSGAVPLVTMSLQTGADGQWMVATARFLPKTPSGPVDGLSPECMLVPACDAIWQAGALQTACFQGFGGAPAEQRVALGGEHGCMLPIARVPDDVARWRQLLPALLGQLGLGDDDLLVVMPEARSRYDAVLAVLGGFVDAGLRAPHVGTTLLVEGNDGPPVCNAPVRDAYTLDMAGARWLGTLAADPVPKSHEL